MQVGVYTDYPYHRVGEAIYAERAFALFLAALAPHFSSFSVIGRLSPEAGRARYELGAGVELVPLPYYPSLSRPGPALIGMAGALRRYWRALDSLDCVWLLGPHPLAFPFAAMARLRGRRVVLGVRQDLPAYTRRRHPGSRLLRAAARLMETGFRLLARRLPIVAVGPEIAAGYRNARELLELNVSLVADQDVVDPAQAEERSYSGELVALSVGRLDAEKNPLLLADALARLRKDSDRWRLLVCGEGPLESELAARLEQLGLREHAELRGYVPFDGGLRELYRSSHVLLISSWTEGLPQVLWEAFAAGLPVASTDVGGIRAAAGDAVSLVDPGDADALASAVASIAADEARRGRMIEAGNRLVRDHTLEREAARLAAFIQG